MARVCDECGYAYEGDRCQNPVCRVYSPETYAKVKERSDRERAEREERQRIRNIQREAMKNSRRRLDH